ncbi:MAG: type II methionyl aminopeptidase [Desulfurococcaceae archaeon]|jgi:methionyl aminopeptidase
MFSDEVIKKLIKAGEIAKKALRYAERVTKPGVKVLDLANSIEKYVEDIGGKLAFPVNIGVNTVAAHYTPVYMDDTIIPDNSVVKIDLGVHVDGYIADTALTVCFNPVYEGLLEATRKSLEKALEVIKPGIRASEIGKIIENTIRSHGYKPIKNLSGHGIERYTIHSGVIIPNYNDLLNVHRLYSGVYAIEPFATNGAGLVKELNQVTIYALRSTSRELPDEVKSFYEKIYNDRRELPFTTRWYIQSNTDVNKVRETIATLKKYKLLVEYPVLVEKENGLVSQFEHTIIVTRKEVIITTA